jgi:hypothetical protein
MFVNVFTSAPGHNVSMIRRIQFISLTALLVLFWVSSAAAVSTVDCHCFRDREFSPQNPTAYDPYLLATVQNRLLAHAFNIPRKEIVSTKMAGAKGDTLWVAHWVAKVSSKSFAEVRTVYAKHSSWQKTIAELSVNREKLGAVFQNSLKNEDESLLAWAVVTQVSNQYLSDRAIFAALRDRGASLKEAILATLLGELKGVSAVDLLDQAIQDGHWGTQLVSSRLTVESVESFLKKKFSS